MVNNADNVHTKDEKNFFMSFYIRPENFNNMHLEITEL